VNSYDPDDKPAEAQQMVADAISDALREIDLRRSLTVQRTVDSLDGEAYEVLEITRQGKMKHPQMETVGAFVAYSNQLQALNRLLDMWLVQPAFPTFSAEQARAGILTKDVNGQFTYGLTAFGQVVIAEARTRLARI
jgi:hypothetical protein